MEAETYQDQLQVTEKGLIRAERSGRRCEHEFSEAFLS